MVRKLADFYNSTRSARKVIVVDLGFLGDSVHLLPALVEIKRSYVDADSGAARPSLVHPTRFFNHHIGFSAFRMVLETTAVQVGIPPQE